MSKKQIEPKAVNCPHCDTPVDEHEASCCLDAWVAEVVMGRDIDGELRALRADAHPESYAASASRLDLWRTMFYPYSIDIAAAWEVVEKMNAPNMGVGGDSWKLEWLAGSYRAGFGYGQRVKDVTYWQAIAPTAPLAICRAALKAAVNG